MSLRLTKEYENKATVWIERILDYSPSRGREYLDMEELKMSDLENESGEGNVKHQIICGKCGMVYEIRYLSESCRYVEGEGYLCMNCNTVLEPESVE